MRGAGQGICSQWAALGTAIILICIVGAKAARAEMIRVISAPDLEIGELRPPIRPQIRHTPDVSGPLRKSDLLRPKKRTRIIPKARWDFRPEGREWSKAALSAIASHGRRLDHVVPQDIERWCPGYRENPTELRRAFWVGLLSALAKHESTWRPEAVGGGGRWYGLLQIYPDTARRYGCQARSGAALKDGPLNLSCAIRILNVTVPRDQAIAVKAKRWRGIAADWGPMTKPDKIAEMSSWTRTQSYCKRALAPVKSLRPLARTDRLAVAR